MTALATLDDLKSNGIEVIDEQTATSLLDSVSDAVRSAAGCPITLGEWTVDIPGEQSRKLDLPCKAVRSVSRVLIDGKTVYDWRLLGSSLYREGPSPSRVAGIRYPPILSDWSARTSRPDSTSSRTVAPAHTSASAMSASTTHRSATRKAIPPKST